MVTTEGASVPGSRRVQSEEDWEKLRAEAHQEYDSGGHGERDR